ncbi:type II secretion system F family protein [Thermoflexus sp.]|uniref:type II secretion system F family protein n=1 Tax=Thermoflexus sp. TaxID=1969742 RepID=UPI002ADE6A5C|nr:type II secretion system F family protein [Thermoflexus sp.]
METAISILAGVIVGIGVLLTVARPTERRLLESGVREIRARLGLEGALRSAGIDMPVGMFLQFLLLWAAGGFSFGMILGLGIVSAIMLAVFGASFYYIRLKEEAAERRLRLAMELMVFLRATAGGLRAGLPRSEAIQRAKEMAGPLAREVIGELEAGLARAGASPEARRMEIERWEKRYAHPVVTATAQVLLVLASGGAGIQELVEAISDSMDRVRRILQVARARGRGMQRQIYMIIGMSAAGLSLLVGASPEFRNILIGNPINPVLVVGGWFGALLLSEYIMDRFFSMEETVGISRGKAGLIPQDRYGRPILPG